MIYQLCSISLLINVCQEDVGMCVMCVCVCPECYSEESDHEEAETTEAPPPPYSEQMSQDSVDVGGPPGSGHQVSGHWAAERVLTQGIIPT